MIINYEGIDIDVLPLENGKPNTKLFDYISKLIKEEQAAWQLRDPECNDGLYLAVHCSLVKTLEQMVNYGYINLV